MPCRDFEFFEFLFLFRLCFNVVNLCWYVIPEDENFEKVVKPIKKKI